MLSPFLILGPISFLRTFSASAPLKCLGVGPGILGQASALGNSLERLYTPGRQSSTTRAWIELGSATIGSYCEVDLTEFLSSLLEIVEAAGLG